jgi:PAS domain S-box-containing protein
LELQGSFKVDTAGSTEEALVKLEKEAYDAVVSDYQMPGKDGLEFLEMLRKNGNTTPFIMFTGKGREEVAVRAWSLGADHYVNKTGDPETVYCELAHYLRSTVEKHFAEARMKETVQKLQTIYQNAVEGISYVDAEENIVFANKAFADIAGYEPDQLVGMNLRRMVDDENWARIEYETKRRRRGEYSRYEAEFRRSDGTARNVLISGAPLLNHDGRFAGTIGIVLDITDRKKAEDALRASEERYRVISSVTADFVFSCAKKGEGKFVIDWIAGAVKNVLGYSDEEIRERGCWKFVVQEQDLPIFEKKVTGLNPGQSGVCELRINHKDGSTRWIKISSKVVEEVNDPANHRLFGTCEDITERKQMEKQLKESEEKYRGLFENARDTIVTFDLKGNITSVNKVVAEYGFKQNELVGKSMLKLVSKKYWPKLLAELGMIAHGRSVEGEIELDTPQGKKLVEYRSNPIRKQNRIVGFQGILRDITGRKKADEALFAERDRLETVTRSISAGLAIISKDYRTLWANDVLKGIFGDVEGKTCYSTYNQSNSICPECGVQEIFETGKAKVVHEQAGKDVDGKTVWSEITATPVKDRDGNITAVLELVVPITQRKRAEENLRDSAEKHRKLFDEAMDAIFVADAETGMLIDCNLAALELVGREKSDLIGKHQRILHPPEEITEEGISKTFKQHLEEKEGQVLKTRIITKRGDIKKVAVKASIIEIGGKKVLQGIFRDITEERKAEEALQSSSELARSLLEFQNKVIDTAVVHIDMLDREGNVTLWNRAAELISGYSREEVIGHKKIWEWLYPESQYRARIFAQAKRTIDHEESTMQNFETVIRCKNGDLKTISWYANSITDGKGKPAGSIAIGLDVSELKRAERELNETMEKLHAINEKLRVVGGLTRHDVRNKLSVILGNTYLAEKELAKDSKVLDYLGEAETAVQQVIRIFDFARAYEMLGAQELKYLEVDKAIDEAVSLFSDLKGVRVTNDCHGLSVLADSLLKQLFYNLIDNSLKYGQKTTRIRVHWEEQCQDGLRLVYEDDGVGISDAEKPKLFKEGYSTGGSTGYGLYLINKMMEVYGWTIDETGVPGKGVQFTISVPKAKRDGKPNYKLA